jgi:hypothetical protein
VLAAEIEADFDAFERRFMVGERVIVGGGGGGGRERVMYP